MNKQRIQIFVTTLLTLQLFASENTAPKSERPKPAVTFKPQEMADALQWQLRRLEAMQEAGARGPGPRALRGLPFGGS